MFLFKVRISFKKDTLIGFYLIRLMPPARPKSEQLGPRPHHPDNPVFRGKSLVSSLSVSFNLLVSQLLPFHLFLTGPSLSAFLSIFSSAKHLCFSQTINARLSRFGGTISRKGLKYILKLKLLDSIATYLDRRIFFF